MRGDALPQDRLTLGSIIEVFPGRRQPTTLADVWRSGSVPGAGPMRVRMARLEDFAAIRGLQRQACPFAAPWTLKQVESQLHAFPEGQLVAVSDGGVVGASSSLVVRWDEYSANPTWREVTGDGHFTTHQPDGRTLYSMQVVADAPRHGYGVARALLQAERRLARRLNLRRIITTARLAGYAALREGVSPEIYAMRVIWGDLDDPAMRFKLAQGFQFCGILHGHRPEDEESGGHAALLAWLNPMYAPPGPPAYMASRRHLKSA
jgi:GNAT superfamily N-acetyltransferase